MMSRFIELTLYFSEVSNNSLGPRMYNLNTIETITPGANPESGHCYIKFSDDPHNYVLRCSYEQAKVLITKGDTPLYKVLNG